MNFILRVVMSALAVLITCYLIPGIHIGQPAWSVLIGASILFIHTLIRPFMIILTLPLSLFFVRLFVIILNAAAIFLLACIVPDFTVVNFWTALAFSTVLSINEALLNATVQSGEV